MSTHFLASRIELLIETLSQRCGLCKAFGHVEVRTEDAELDALGYRGGPLRYCPQRLEAFQKEVELLKKKLRELPRNGGNWPHT